MLAGGSRASPASLAGSLLKAGDSGPSCTPESEEMLCSAKWLWYRAVVVGNVAAEGAAEVLAEVDEVRRLTRRQVRTFAFPFFFYGLAALVAAGFGEVVPSAVGWWWVAANVVGSLAIFRHYRVRAIAVGVSSGWRRYALAWGVAAVAMGVAFGLAPARFHPLLPWVVVGVTYVGLGVTGDGPQLVAMGAGLCVVGVIPMAGVAMGVPANALAGALLLLGGLASLALACFERSW